MNDLSLVAQVAVFRNKRAFDQLVRKYQSPVRQFFLNLTLGDRQLSDDLAQETFIKAYTHIASFRGLSSFSTWLYRIGYRVFYDYTRSRKETTDITALRAKESANSDPTLKMDVYKALERLNDNERTCITLQVVEGLPIEKIAEVLGMPQGTVKSHLSRGKKQLAEYLRNNGYGKQDKIQ